MKTLVVGLIMLLSFGGFSQINQGSSGVQTFNIGTKKTEKNEGQTSVKKNVDVGSSEKELFLISKKDEKAPEITLLSPIENEGNPLVVSTMKLQITGSVADESGILSIIVNNAEAVVAADGKFQADVLLAYGENTIQIKAIDIHKNIQIKTLTVERKVSEIKDVVPDASENLTSLIEISWLMTGKSPYSTTFESFKIRACIEAADEILETQIFNNGVLLTKLSKSDLKFRGDCSYSIEQDVTLKKGLNEVKIIAKTSKGTQESVISVNYSPLNSRYFALIIGVDNYLDDKIQDLDQPVKDAAKLKAILQANYTFNQEDITLLSNPTKADIIGTLHELRKKITANDNLLIFYAGHGYWDEEMQLGYWLPTDANNDNPVNWIPNTDLTNYISAIKSKHTLLIADACFSGGIFKTRTAFNNQMALEKLMELKSRKAMTSGTLTEVPDKSVFIDYLVRRLSENNNKYISSEQLFSEMRMAVINNSDNIPQYGTIHNTGDEGGDFVFILR